MTLRSSDTWNTSDEQEARDFLRLSTSLLGKWFMELNLGETREDVSSKFPLASLPGDSALVGKTLERSVPALLTCTLLVTTTLYLQWNWIAKVSPAGETALASNSLPGLWFLCLMNANPQATHSEWCLW